MAESAPDPGLERECRALSRYLLGQDPDAYVIAQYARGHASIPCRRSRPDAFDGLLVLMACRGAVTARVADAYARFFRPRGALRQKLTLMLAVLENAPLTHARLTRGGRGVLRALADTVMALAGTAVALGGGIVLLGPLHLLLAGRRPAPSR